MLCDEQVIQTCTAGQDGCLRWVPGINCADDGRTCDDSETPAVCVLNQPSCTNPVRDGAFEVGKEWMASGVVECMDESCGAGATAHGGREFVRFTGEMGPSGGLFQSMGLSGGTATLSFWLRIPESAPDSQAALSVVVNNSVVKEIKAAESAQYANWIQVTTDISEHAGGMVDLIFSFTADPLGKKTIFDLDDVVLDVCIPCTSDCTVAGAQQCDGVLVETCDERVNHCLYWVPTQDCSPLEQQCVHINGTSACGQPLVCKDQNVVQDDSFEAGGINSAWTVQAPQGQAVWCTSETCGNVGGVGAHSGNGWARLQYRTDPWPTVTQNVTGLDGPSRLRFWLRADASQATEGVLEVLLDSQRVWGIYLGNDAWQQYATWKEVVVDIPPTTGTHVLTFQAVPMMGAAMVTDLDDVRLEPCVAPCHNACTPGDQRCFFPAEHMGVCERVEDGCFNWVVDQDCTAAGQVCVPTIPAPVCAALGCADILRDGSFESGHPSTAWTEHSSENTAVLCNATTCPDTGLGLEPYAGSWYARLGGPSSRTRTDSLSQSVTITSPGTGLIFWLKIVTSGEPRSDTLVVSMDDQEIFRADVLQGAAQSYRWYMPVRVDLSSFADGTPHTLTLESAVAPSTEPTYFLLDDVKVHSCDCREVVEDASLELGVQENSPWTSSSTHFGTAICTAATCPREGIGVPHTGTTWVWLGGIANGTTNEVANLIQRVALRPGPATLAFWLRIEGDEYDMGINALTVNVGNNTVFRVSTLEARNFRTFQRVQVPLQTEGGYFDLEFSTIIYPNPVATGFHVDDVQITQCAFPNECDATGAPTCSGNRVQQCNQGGSGARELTTVMDCGVINAQCDDTGSSAVCKREGTSCQEAITNGGLESPLGWDVQSLNPMDNLCTVERCVAPTDGAPHGGMAWARLCPSSHQQGDITASQTVVLGPGQVELSFWLRVTKQADIGIDDMLIITVDDLPVWEVGSANAQTYLGASYKKVTVDLSQHADGKPHLVAMNAVSASRDMDCPGTVYLVDDVSVTNCLPPCTADCWTPGVTTCQGNSVATCQYVPGVCQAWTTTQDCAADGWACTTEPQARCDTGCVNILPNGDFEQSLADSGWMVNPANPPEPFWCTQASCDPEGNNVTSHLGQGWLRLHGPRGSPFAGSVTRDAVLPSGRVFLKFWVAIPQSSSSPDDKLFILVNGAPYEVTNASMSNDHTSYQEFVAEFVGFPPGMQVTLGWLALTNGSAVTSFFLDDARLCGIQ